MYTDKRDTDKLYIYTDKREIDTDKLYMYIEKIEIQRNYICIQIKERYREIKYVYRQKRDTEFTREFWGLTVHIYFMGFTRGSGV